MEEQLLTVTEVAHKLNVSLRTIQRYCKQGRLAHKWVMGKRHKELRIISPIPLSELPGGRRKTLGGSFDYVSSETYRHTVDGLQAELAGLKSRIEGFERELAGLNRNAPLPDGGVFSENRGSPGLSDVTDRVREIVDDYEKVRPSEKKLILKLAREVREHEDYLVSIGKNPSVHSASEDQ